jgi:hypothetical protein
MLKRPFGSSAVLLLVGVAGIAYGSSRNEIKLLAISGNQEVNPNLDESIYEIDLTNAKPEFIKKLTQVPGGVAFGWNPVNGLLYHTSGDSSWSDDTTSNGYRDNEYMETYDLDTGDIVAVYNANPPPPDPAPNDISVWGLPAPRPDWVLPDPRRSVGQTDPMWQNEPGVGQGPDEIGQIRGMAWSQAKQLWYVTSFSGLFKATPGGGAEFVGQPEDDPGTSADEGSDLKGITLYHDPVTHEQRYLVGVKRDFAIWDIDTETGQLSNRVEVTLVDENGAQVGPDENDGILALAQDPATGILYGIDRHPDSVTLGRNLFTIDPETGVGVVIGQLEVESGDTAMASLQFTGWIVGDVNGDGEVNGLDVDPFVAVLLNGSTELLLNLKADMNGDGEVNGLDVDPFVAAVIGGGTQPIPEPSTLLLAILALGMVGEWRKWGG